LKATAAKYKRTLNANTRNSWREKTESLNLDRDGNKLWRLVKTLNNEDNFRAPIQIKRNNVHLVGKKATNAIAEHFANANTIIVPQESQDAVRIEQKINENVMYAAYDD
jgi:hypothetical protein